MEINSSSKLHQERENHSYSPTNSPNSSSNSNGGGGVVLQNPTPPVTPKTILRSDNSNPYPTTFVQADTCSFKQVVQLLTGSVETTKQASKPAQDPAVHTTRSYSIPPMKSAPKKQGFKLYERRNNLKNNLMINTLVPNFAHHNSGVSPRYTGILSPSLLDFPSLTLSPVTPLNDDPFRKSSPSLGNSSEEEKAIAEKGFYLHPSPRTGSLTESKPQLLPLFPVTSPKISGSSS